MLLSFRPTKKVMSYLKPLKNKSKEINDILEKYILQPKQHQTRVSNWTSWDITYIDIEKVLTESKLEREAPLFDDIEPIQEVVKDKKYFDNLNKYTTIKNMWWCFSANWERLDTQEALEYANLQSFIP
jgi:hypothetical protein